MEKKVLVVEDDEMLNAGICYNLEKEGYNVNSAYTLSGAKDKLENSELFSLVILDINLPDGNGLELCRQIENMYAIPVIMLTAKDTEQDVIAGFDAGADDYVTKPFSIAILLKRIAAVLARRKPANSMIQCGNLRINLLRSEISRKGIPLMLTSSEWKLLRYFLANENQTLTRGQLIESLWDVDGDFVDEHTLTSLMSRLRKKLADDQYGYIKTYYGSGYKWLGEKND